MMRMTKKVFYFFLVLITEKKEWVVTKRLNLSHESELSRGVKGSFLPKVLPFLKQPPGAFRCNRHLKERLHFLAGCR